MASYAQWYGIAATDRACTAMNLVAAQLTGHERDEHHWDGTHRDCKS
jgi:hypothetical protein